MDDVVTGTATTDAATPTTGAGRWARTLDTVTCERCGAASAHSDELVTWFRVARPRAALMLPGGTGPRLAMHFCSAACVAAWFAGAVSHDTAQRELSRALGRAG